LPTIAQRQAANAANPSDPDIFPGTGNVAAPDGPGSSQKQKGYIWNAALRAGLSIRDYGFFADLTRYTAPAPYNIPLEPNPFQIQLQVTYPTMPELIATQRPMTAAFDLDERDWSYSAKPSALLKNTQLPIPPSAFASYKKIPKSTHDAAYWAEVTKGFDFSVEDHLGDPDKFNRIVWQGLKGNVPYPAERNSADLRKNRRQLLRAAGWSICPGMFAHFHNPSQASNPQNRFPRSTLQVKAE
jgi:hypothetical protein